MNNDLTDLENSNNDPNYGIIKLGFNNVGEPCVKITNIDGDINYMRLVEDINYNIDLEKIIIDGLSTNSGGATSKTIQLKPPSIEISDCILFVTYGNSRNTTLKVDGQIYEWNYTSGMYCAIINNLTIDTIIEFTTTRSNTSQTASVSYSIIWIKP